MRILIADDHALFRDSLKSLLSARGHFVAGEARDGREAVELARKLKPDIVLMDLSMPEVDGLTATRLVWKLCWTWAYLARALVAAVLPGRETKRYLLHARQELFPRRGEGIRDAAEARNRALANNVPARHGAR